MKNMPKNKEILVKIDQDFITSYMNDNMKDKSIIYEVKEIPLSLKSGSTITFGKIRSTEYSHGIYSYPAKFIPQIARWGIKKTHTEAGQLLLDPFCGSGTSLVEAHLRGINSYGIDKNPLARLLSKVKSTPLFPNHTKLLYEAIEDIIHKIKNDKTIINLNNQKDVNLHFNWGFWFEEDIMKEIIKIKRNIRTFKFKTSETSLDDLRNFFLVVLASTIKRVSYLDEGQIKVKKSHEKVKRGVPKPLDIFSQLSKKYSNAIIEFTIEVKKHSSTFANIIGDDARKINLPNNTVNLVLTSPPYINAIDYPFAHKHELFILDLVMPDDYRPHSREYIGVSERVLLKNMYKDLYLTNFEPVDQIIKTIYHGGKDVDSNRAFIIYQYFTEMQKALSEFKRVLRDDGHFVMFVGSNTIRNHYVPTHELLKQIAEERLGFHITTYFYHQMKKKKLGIPRNVTGGEIPKEMAIVFEKE